MVVMKTAEGNLVTLAQAGQFDAICHGANCRNTMGAGIALQISRAFPKAREADEAAFKFYSERSMTMLGHMSLAHIEQPRVSHVLTVYNWYTQVYPGHPDSDRDSVTRRLLAIKRCAENTARVYRTNRGGKRIGLPLIGCGLAGLSEADVLPILETAFDGLDCTLVRLSPKA
jgi:O-acetyl-ADP-ribose deacetylase (regulator of RNase III)